MAIGRYLSDSYYAGVNRPSYRLGFEHSCLNLRIGSLLPHPSPFNFNPFKQHQHFESYYIIPINIDIVNRIHLLQLTFTSRIASIRSNQPRNRESHSFDQNQERISIRIHSSARKLSPRFEYSKSQRQASPRFAYNAITKTIITAILEQSIKTTNITTVRVRRNQKDKHHRD